MGGKSSKTTQENKPPAWSVPLFEKSASEAQKIYDSGAGGNVYQGQTVAGLGNTTQAGIQGVQNTVAGLPSATSSANNLAGMASGSYLKDGNPHFNAALDNQLQKAGEKIQSQFSGAGRYGSGANTSVLTNQLGGLATSALSDQFNRDTQNMLTANNMIDSSSSNLFQNKLAGNQAVMGAGQIQDANKQAQLTSDFTKWQSNDMKDWNRLGLLQSAAAGSAGNYGTNTQTQTQPFNAAQGIGALGSLFTKSDARAKINIVPVTVENSYPVYEFSYRGHAGERWRGVMAQDVIERDPLAISIDRTDGLFMVDYARLGIEPRRVA